jgi:hypothetical protein
MAIAIRRASSLVNSLAEDRLAALLTQLRYQIKKTVAVAIKSFHINKR